MSQQREVSVPCPTEPAIEGSEEGRETRAFFFEYLSRRAKNDSELRDSDAQIIHQERQEAVQVVVGSSDAAAEVAARLADLGECVGVGCLWARSLMYCVWVKLLPSPNNIVVVLPPEPIC